ncbi:hypothetical protein [Streptomyces sp. SPB4]|uniref:hypothetical protein n=1 Tax=Streptomyces TaxID=1883 RepID=UPI0024741AB5|nr:hypothetical protein [Streptomyces sp. SPB4]MDH6545461.1 hypothetical protein [Streptomyces sp. SPB4]
MLAGTARRIRFGTVLAVVVLSLTGFSTHGGSSGNGSGGGGCSSSKSSGKSSGKSSSNSSKTTRKNYGGTDATPAASPSPTGPPATTTLISCGDVSDPSTTIEVTSLLGRAATFEVSMYREEAGGAVIETTSGRIALSARGTGRTVIAMKNRARAGAVAACRISSVHVVPDASATPGATNGPAPTSGSGTVTSGSRSTPKPGPKTTGKAGATSRP